MRTESDGALPPINDVLIESSRSSSSCIAEASATSSSASMDSGPLRVLAGAIELFCQQWEVDLVSQAPTSQQQLQKQQPQDGKVLQYLKPEDMLFKLFTERGAAAVADTAFGGGDGTSSTSSSTSTTSMINSLSLRRRSQRGRPTDAATRPSANNDGGSEASDNDDNINKADCDIFISLLGKIQRYSLNTSHPNFFNQLFGATDPVALAGDLLSLGLNTCAFTYEIAPVWAMIEHEVMHRLGRLVFEGKDEEDDEDDDSSSDEIDWDVTNPKYDGIMVSGGSLSNLTALHVARHRWLVANGYDPPIFSRQESLDGDDDVPSVASSDLEDEEKKDEYPDTTPPPVKLSFPSRVDKDDGTSPDALPPTLVAFVSTEAHYSFRKAMAVTGIGASNLIVVPTLANGQMDPRALDEAIRGAKQRGFAPFFVAATSGSTVRGSFDDIAAIVDVCRSHEVVESTDRSLSGSFSALQSSIWVHVDGAWGGSAIFSRRSDVRSLFTGVDRVDSFTFNPHKMLGAPMQTTALVTRHCGLLKASNSTRAKYLFDPRKNGAEYDLGDATFTCGRRPDVIKLWALWKYHGRQGLGKRVDDKVTSLASLSCLIRQHDAFMLACEPWPFNINFFYLPPRIQQELQVRGIPTNRSQGSSLPSDISRDIAKVSVELKLRLHESGEMMIPFQPLNDQKADCFRLVLGGAKTLSRDELSKVLAIMDRYGRAL